MSPKEKAESKDGVYNQEIAELKEDKKKLNEELDKIKNVFLGYS